MSPGCSLGGGGGVETGRTASSAQVVLAPSPTPTPPGLGSVWILSPVGLNLRTDPSATSTRITTLSRGLQMDVTGSAAVGSVTWLHVRSHSGGGSDGWVLDDPELVIHRPVASHIDSLAGWSLLFPAEWTLKTGAPTELTGSGQLLQVWTAAESRALPEPPGTPGREVRDEGPVVIFSTTTFLTVYQLDSGGYEFDARIKAAEGRFFEFRFRVSGPTADTGLFKQILASVAFN